MNATRPPSHPSPDPEHHNDDGALEAGMPCSVSHNTLRQMAYGFVMRWYWIALGLTLGLLGAEYQLSKTPKQYTATATLLIKQQTNSVMSRDHLDEINLNTIEGMNTIAVRIQRKDLLARVASQPDVRALSGLMPSPVDWMPLWLRPGPGRVSPSANPAGQSPPPAAELGSVIAGWLRISIRHGTRLLDISFTHTAPEVAKALANAVAHEYLTEIANGSTQDRSRSIELLENKSMTARASLRAAGSILAMYGRSLAVLEKLDTKEAEVATLQRRYLPKHPKLMAANADLSQLKEGFIHEFAVARDNTSDESSLEMTRKELPDPQTHPDEYVRASRQQLLSHISVLESEIRSSTTVFNSMLTRIQETSVNQAAEESSAEISELACMPTSPSSPVSSKILATGLLRGLAGGLLLVFLLVRLDDKCHTASQISNLTGVKVLGAIPDIKINRLAVAAKHYWKRHPGKAADLHETWEKRLIFRAGTASTSYAEIYRSLRASISGLGTESNHQITLFSSALPGEGKTLTSANFAAGAAADGRRTLLIDLDLRKPAVHKIFGVCREPEHGGITEYLGNLAAFEEVIYRETGQPNLHLLLAGKHASNPAELLDPRRIKEMLDQACRHYDVVVLDTAPFLAVPDTRAIAPLAHHFCLVAKADYVPKGAIRRALEILQEDNIPLSGIIFNGYKERHYLMGENYSYGYYRHSRYGRYCRYSYDSYGAHGYSTV